MTTPACSFEALQRALFYIFLNDDPFSFSLMATPACSFEALQRALPYICTASTKANTAKRFPSEIIPGLLYLGDWAHAEAVDRLSELNIRRCGLPRMALFSTFPRPFSRSWAGGRAVSLWQSHKP